MKMKITKRKIIITIIFLLIIVLGYYFAVKNKPQTEYTTEKVTRGELIQTVSETGAVKAADKINLNFLSTGRIAKINVAIGDKVVKDQVLAELDNQSLILKSNEARANLQVAQANLNKLLAGATAADLNVSQANINKAQAAYNSALDEQAKINKTVTESIAQAQKKLDDLLSQDASKTTYRQSMENAKLSALTTVNDKLTTVNTSLDAINTIITNDDIKNYLSAKDTSYLINTRNYYDDAEILLSVAQTSLATARANQAIGSINQALDDALAALNKTFSSLNSCFSALNQSLTSTDFTQTQLDAYKTTISTDLTAAGTAITTVQTAKDTLTNAVVALEDATQTARNNLTSAQKSGDQQLASAQAQVDAAKKAWDLAIAQYDQTKASPRSEDISLYQAQVAQAQAALDIAQKQVDDSVIKAPIDGVITESNYEVGEQVSAAPALAMVGETGYEIKVDISEADIYKIRVGNAAEITLDAFGEDVKFPGSVIFIEPAETIIQDVVYYKVTVELNNDSQVPEVYYKNIKPGMTANITITTAQKENALIASGRGIIDKNSDKFARILVNGQPQEIPVKVGIKGDGGMVEILDGLKEGDEVVTYIKTPTS